MASVKPEILEQVIAATAEPVVVARVDHPDWPVELCNPAFEALGGDDAAGTPFADVVERLLGRELALEISESVRSRNATSLPVEIGGHDYLLALKPILLPGYREASHYAAFLRSAAAGGGDADMQHALLKAKRRIRDLSRDDPVTGLLNERAFRDVLDHDWAVGAREKSALALVVFTLDHFPAYVEVFGRHASDSCLRRVGQAIRRCLRRASDVVARFDDDKFIVLAHAPEESGVRDFAARIAKAVRELGLHHPRSGAGRFVTVSYDVDIASPAGESRSAREVLDELLVRASG